MSISQLLITWGDLRQLLMRMNWKHGYEVLKEVKTSSSQLSELHLLMKNMRYDRKLQNYILMNPSAEIFFFKVLFPKSKMNLKHWKLCFKVQNFNRKSSYKFPGGGSVCWSEACCSLSIHRVEGHCWRRDWTTPPRQPATGGRQFESIDLRSGCASHR